MACISRLVLSLAALGVSCGVAQAAGVSTRHEFVGNEVASTAPLFNLVKELRSEAASGRKFHGSMAEWCRDSMEQNKDLSGVLRRRIDEVTTGSRQLTEEGRRIASEESLANSTNTEKEHQLQEATATAKLASDEFGAQQKQLEKILQATEKAMRLVGETQASGGATGESTAAVADLASSLEEVPTLKMAVSTSGSSAEELSDMLGQLRSKLTTDRGAATEDHALMLAKLKTFSEDLTASIAKSHSQVVMLNMEMAQRRRELDRLDGQSSDLAALLQAVERGALATQRACSDEDTRKGEVGALVVAESAAVDTLLRQLALSSPTATGSEASFSFVQTSQKALRRSRRSPDDGLSAEQDVQKDKDDHAALLRKLDGMEAAAKMNLQVVDDSAHVDVKSDALQDISQFVNTADSGDRKQDKSSSRARLLGRHRSSKAKAAVPAARHAAQRHSQCIALLHKYAGQSSTLAQTSSDTLNAELRVSKRAIAGFEQEVEFNQQRKDNIQAKLLQFSGLSKDVDLWTKRSSDALRGHAEELMTLSVDLSQKLSPEEQSASKSTRSLAQKLLTHVGALENRRSRFSQNRASVEKADQEVMSLLAEGLEYSHRRIVQLSPEAQVLASLVEAKTRDNTFANEYQELVDALCSKEVGNGGTTNL